MRGATSKPGLTESAAAAAAGTTASPETVRLHVFLDGSVRRDQLDEAAGALIAEIRGRLPQAGASLKLLTVSRIGRSLLMEGDADAMALIRTLPHVVDVLGTDLEDVMPQPVGRRMVG